MEDKVMVNEKNSLLSAILVVGLVVIGLAGGWVLMNIVTNRTIPINQSGVSAQVPAGWIVNAGLHGEELIFWASEPLNADHRYVVSILPAVPGGTLTDVVVTRNLARSQAVTGYVVIDQSQIEIQNLEGYRVGFAYTLPGGRGVMPRVIEGADYFLPKGDKVLVITLENESGAYAESAGAFIRFLDSVQFPVGG